MTTEAPLAVPPMSGGSALLGEPDQGPPLQRVNEPVTFFRGFIPTVRSIWAFRELLVSLIRKELKVKYKDSALGFLWTLLRPLFLLLIYYIAIGKFLHNSTPGFVVFLFSGLAPWTMFQDILFGSTLCIVSNSALIKKVYFPREIFPLSVVGAALVQFCFQLTVLIAAVYVTGRHLALAPLLYLPVSLLALVLFATSLGVLLSAANVYLRDTQHLIELAVQFWFFMTPIVYAIGMIEGRLGAFSRILLGVYLANPMAIIIMGFQKAVYQYGHIGAENILYTGDLWARLGILIAVCLVFLWVAQRIFARAQGNFAQEM